MRVRPLGVWIALAYSARASPRRSDVWKGNNDGDWWSTLRTIAGVRSEGPASTTSSMTVLPSTSWTSICKMFAPSSPSAVAIRPRVFGSSGNSIHRHLDVGHGEKPTNALFPDDGQTSSIVLRPGPDLVARITRGKGVHISELGKEHAPARRHHQGGNAAEHDGTGGAEQLSRYP